MKFFYNVCDTLYVECFVRYLNICGNVRYVYKALCIWLFMEITLCISIEGASKVKIQHF